MPSKGVHEETEKVFLVEMCIGSYTFFAVGTSKERARDSVWKRYKESGFYPPSLNNITKKYLMDDWFGTGVYELEINGEAELV